MGPSTVKVDPLQWKLKQNPWREDTVYLELGFQDGFFIPFQGQCIAEFSNNQKSIRSMEQLVKAKIEKEVATGWVIGPFLEPPILIGDCSQEKAWGI